MADQVAVILSKSRTASTQHERLEAKILAGLEGSPNVEVTVIPHLYDQAPDGPALELLRSIQGNLVVLAWLYPRATYWVLSANRITGRLGHTSSLPEEDAEEPSDTAPEAPQRTIWCFDLRTHVGAEVYLREIHQIAAPVVVTGGQSPQMVGNGQATIVDEATGPRWYPVIDFDACTHCLECLNFCLFGVYGLEDEERIVIEEPDACRAGCPACSRICPEGAIMFPQHKDPAIAGDPTASKKGLRLDLSQLFAAAGPADLAAAERERALADERGQKPRPEADKTAKGPDRDDLDQLVDELDDLDL